MDSMIRDIMTLFFGSDPDQFTRKEVTGFKLIFGIAIGVAAILTYSKLFA